MPMNSNTSTKSILNGIKVLDLSWGISGPITSMMLSDNGAKVIKIEPLTGDPFRDKPGYTVWGRGKQSLALNLQSVQGKAIITKLVERSDIVLESFSPGVSERLDISYEALTRFNPRLIYCSISGYGSSGTQKYKPGFDQIVAARTGIYEQPGFRPGPTFVSLPLPSYGAALLAVQGIGVALYVREVSGEGQKIETSLLAGSLAMQPHLVSGVGMASNSFSTGPLAGASPYGSLPF